VFELTKNSLRAVADRFEDSADTEPPIRVVISRGDEDITIKVRRVTPLSYSCICSARQCVAAVAAVAASERTRHHPCAACMRCKKRVRVLQVSDEGGGIPRSGVARIWTYMYSTAKVPLPDMEAVAEEQPAVLAGYGYGLPLSRLYTRYFGGDLQVISMEGYGTDAYIHLNRLGDSHEPLP
jgi:pyruvate dehydrogenase kinase 2/3/4